MVFMVKKHLVVSLTSLGLGILIGIGSSLLVSSSASPARLFSKLHFGTGSLTATSQPGGGQTSPGDAAQAPGSDRPQLSLNAPGNGGNAVNGAGTSGTGSATDPGSGSASAGSDAVPSPSSGPAPSGSSGTSGQGSQSAGSASGASGQGSQSPASGTGSAEPVPPAAAQAIIADYKQDIGTFFDAWKCQNVKAFKAELAKGYAGPLLDSHVKQAEPYITRGVGIDARSITFDSVTVENANADSATLRADYRYTAGDCNLKDGKGTGVPTDHSVHVRVNLVKINQRWIITGETPLNA
ncbi:hypothetical protein CEB3_c43090 [Peptococcaceae bacterium CEB3]|nr:hypothetical protein CEB3_c43090 [Peptococcaceae bacterium CEB3]